MYRLYSNSTPRVAARGVLVLTITIRRPIYMDDQFLKTIIDSVPGQLSAERIENFKIRREAQLRRLMAWYGVNRDRAKEIQAEMGFPYIRL